MKIIDDKTKTWSSEQTCKKNHERDGSGCGTKVELTLEDVEVFHWFGTHFQHKYPGWYCPACHKMNKVVEAPDWLYNMAKEKESKFDGYSDLLY